LFNNMGRNPVDKPRTKNKSSVVFIVVVFGAVGILMFVARMRSGNMQTIAVPLNNGIVGLLTYKNILGAVSNDNKMYVFEWSNMSKKPREIAVESSEAVFVAPETILSVKRADPDCLVVSRFDANSVSQKIPLSLKSNAASLCASQDGSETILLLERGGGERVTYELFEVEFNTKQVRPIAAIPAEQGRVEHFSVSNDGRYVVAVGEKKEHGWMVAVDTKENKIVWQKELPDLKKLYKGVFSKDGEIIYLRGSDSMLTLVKTGSGEIVDRWLPVKENKDTYRAQPTQTVAISGEGELVAVSVFSNVYIWDTKTRKKYNVAPSGHKVFSGMVFSPDAKFIATSDMRQGGDIKIISTPRH
jgi:WD40 repeat protein